MIVVQEKRKKEIKNMAFKPMGATNESKSTAIKAADVELGSIIEGYLVDFIKTEGQYGVTFSPKLVSEDGEETVLWASGNLKFLKQDCEEQGIKLGTYVRLTKKEPKAGAKIKTYFEREVDSTRVRGGSDF
jgi:hypothetical protein